MSSPLCIVFSILVCLVCFIQPLPIENAGDLIKCTTQKVNLHYTTPLPRASNDQVTTTAKDSGIWSPCTVAEYPANVTYFLSVKLTEANCQQAKFAELVFFGFFNLHPLPFIGAVNFTVNLTDASERRELNIPQIFKGRLSGPQPLNAQLPPPANITFTFRGQHSPGNCPVVTDEQADVDPYVYLLNVQQPVPNPFG